VENEAARLARFRIAQIILKAGEPLPDGVLIKSCIIQCVEELCPEKVELFKTVFR
jgi:hypothetical protein